MPFFPMKKFQELRAVYKPDFLKTGKSLVIVGLQQIDRKKSLTAKTIRMAGDRFLVIESRRDRIFEYTKDERKKSGGIYHINWNDEYDDKTRMLMKINFLDSKVMPISGPERSEYIRNTAQTLCMTQNPEDTEIMQKSLEIYLSTKISEDSDKDHSLPGFWLWLRDQGIHEILPKKLGTEKARKMDLLFSNHLNMFGDPVIIQKTEETNFNLNKIVQSPGTFYFTHHQTPMHIPFRKLNALAVQCFAVIMQKQKILKTGIVVDTPGLEQHIPAFWYNTSWNFPWLIHVLTPGEVTDEIRSKIDHIIHQKNTRDNT